MLYLVLVTFHTFIFFTKWIRWEDFNLDPRMWDWPLISLARKSFETVKTRVKLTANRFVLEISWLVTQVLSSHFVIPLEQKPPAPCCIACTECFTIFKTTRPDSWTLSITNAWLWKQSIWNSKQSVPTGTDRLFCEGSGAGAIMPCAQQPCPALFLATYRCSS